MGSTSEPRRQCATGHAEKDLRNLDALAEAEDLIEFGCQQVTPSVMRAALHECGYLS
jgi:hypothetical protein